MNRPAEQIKDALTIDKGTFVERTHRDGLAALEELMIRYGYLEAALEKIEGGADGDAFQRETTPGLTFGSWARWTARVALADARKDDEVE